MWNDVLVHDEERVPELASCMYILVKCKHGRGFSEGPLWASPGEDWSSCHGAGTLGQCEGPCRAHNPGARDSHSHEPFPSKFQSAAL